jgi:hypothetical protein
LKGHAGQYAPDTGLTIAASSLADGDFHNVARSGRDSYASQNEPGQWFCYDLQESRACITAYTLYAKYLKSWVIEGSEGGASWTEIDRQTDNGFFKDWCTESIDLSKQGRLTDTKWRFIRITQTDKNHNGTDTLELRGFEFFGTLFNKKSDEKS